MHISFRNGLDLPTTEKNLRQFYARSTESNIREVLFDLHSIRAVDPLGLGILLLWSRALREDHKLVSIVAPEDTEVRRYLSSVGFPSVARSSGIQLDLENAPVLEALNSVPVVPLRFLDAESFAALDDEFADEHRRAARLALIRESDLVKTGELTDIVLREIGDNLFQHGEGRFAHLMVTTSRAPRALESMRLIPHGLSALLNAEKRFLDAFRGEEFVVIEIGDMGPGIDKTLRKAFKADPSKSLVRATSASILSYAFRYDSTSRKPTDRVGELERVISSESATYPPATGLYRVKELVRDFHGVLYARSGRGAVVFDFTHDQSTDSPITSDERRVRLEDFPGLQYKILLPTRKPHPALRTAYHVRALEASPSRGEYIDVHQYFAGTASRSLREQAESLDSVLREMDVLFAKHAKGSCTVILDFGWCRRRIQLKPIHCLLFEAMKRQGGPRSVVAINVAADVVKAVQEATEHTAFGRDRPMLAYDELQQPYLVGATAAQAAAIIASAAGPGKVALQALALIYPHLFQFSQDAGGYIVRQTSDTANRISREALARRVAHLLSSIPGVFHPDVKVLLPSQVYCRGYYDIPLFLANPEARDLVGRWLVTCVQHHKPDLVVSIGSCGAVVDEELARATSRDALPIRHIALSGTQTQFVSVQPILGITRSKKVLIFTDVVATMRTIRLVAETLDVTEAPVVVTLVNASQSNDLRLDDARQIRIDSAVERQFALHDALPRDWLYREVCVVDPASHALILPTMRDREPLWKGYVIESNTSDSSGVPQERVVNTFLRDVASTVDSVLLGHFINDSHHYTYVFDTTAIAATHEREIADRIVDDAKRALQGKPPSNADVTDAAVHLLFPTFNPGVERMAAAVAGRFRHARLWPVPSLSATSRTLVPETSDPIIIIDDAFSSGETLLRLIQAAADTRTSLVLAYALIRRGPEDTATRFSNITRFDHSDVHTRFLAAVELPSYTEYTCPACRQQREWKRLRARFRSQLARQLIDRELTLLIPQTVSDALEAVDVHARIAIARDDLNTPIPDNPRRTELRWLLEMSRRSPVEREGLVNLLGGTAHTHDALLLLLTIGAERMPDAGSRDERELLFSPRFVSAIMKAVMLFLRDASSLRSDAIDSLLYLWDSFAPETLLEGIQELLGSTLDDPKRFARICLYAARSKTIRNYPGAMLSILGASANRAATSDLQDFIDEVSIYWSDAKRDLATLTEERLRLYRELMGGAFHELGHKKDDLLLELDRPSRSSLRIQTFWNALREDLRADIVPKTRMFVRGGVAVELCNVIRRRAADLATIAEAGSNVVMRLDGTGRHENATMDELRRLVNLAYEHVYGSSGLRVLLEQFRSNIKSVITGVLGAQQEELERQRITVIRDFSEDLCLVFGDESAVRLVLHNAIENVRKHAKAVTLRVIVRTDAIARQAQILLVDDGVGYDGKHAGAGILNSDRAVRAYCGAFTVVAQPPEFGGRGTKVLITLPLLNDFSS